MNEVSIIPVVQGEEVPKIEDTLLPEKLPILALRNAVLFPGIVYPVTVGREISLRVVHGCRTPERCHGGEPARG